jgi:hypothetical protein
MITTILSSLITYSHHPHLLSLVYIIIQFFFHFSALFMSLDVIEELQSFKINNFHTLRWLGFIAL